MARRLMHNDTAVFEDGSPPGVPMHYIIWWPLRPDPEMLSLLAREVPEMKRQCAAVAIACDYGHIYKEFNPEPSWHLWKVATMFSTNPFYREDQERRGREKKIDLEDDTYMEEHYCEMMQTRQFTVLDDGGNIRNSVEKHRIPGSSWDDIPSTSTV
ncbi:hypothetical protein F53441_14017 [Fusarium austroafricanum]|uniref:Uncharacterized protein n=1 Tax=Fusarium austroafricanum TaxID=2364996 RepID=A0A8H4NH65_9HYPO|nr:hypothetical protein F53441_14017 [Fusarium austroafricanum]